MDKAEGKSGAEVKAVQEPKADDPNAQAPIPEKVRCRSEAAGPGSTTAQRTAGADGGGGGRGAGLGGWWWPILLPPPLPVRPLAGASGREPPLHRRQEAGQGWLWAGVPRAARAGNQGQGRRQRQPGARREGQLGQRQQRQRRWAVPLTLAGAGAVAAAGGAEAGAPQQQGLQLWPAVRVVCVRVSSAAGEGCGGPAAALPCAQAAPRCLPSPTGPWHCCRALGNILGIPKVHYKGRQGDYYIMVRRLLRPCEGRGKRPACVVEGQAGRCCTLQRPQAAEHAPALPLWRCPRR